MSKGQLERALRGGQTVVGSRQEDRALPTPPDGARVALGAPKAKKGTESRKERSAKRQVAPRGGPGENATTAFGSAFQKYGESLRRQPGSRPLVAPRRVSPFGDLVSRLIRRRAEASGSSRERVITAAAAAHAAAPSPATPRSTGSVQSALAVGSVLDPVYVLLVNRVTGAFLESEYELARQLGISGYLDHHFNLTANDDHELNAFFAAVPNILVNGAAPNSPTLPQLWDDVMNGSALDLLTDEALALPGLTPNGVGLIGFLQGVTIGRGILSRRRLLERMTEFWTDHFNIDIYTASQGWLKPVDDREAIRNNALGSFHDMLYESAHSSAMLAYLDQYTSQAPNPNENYARELLELHTVGEGQGYNEDDVRDVADLLTGWSISFSDLGFEYKSAQHVEGPLGGYSILKLDANPIPIAQDPLSSPTEGQQEGEDLIAGLRAHPKTASHIAQKMLRFMLRYDPTPQQVTRVARAYATNGGSCRAMLAEIFTVANLNSLLATDPTTLKVKRPFQLATTFLRQVGGEPEWSTTQVGLIEAGGSGYAIGDQLEIQGGTLEAGGSAALFEVTDIEVSGGAITSMKLVSEGDYSTYPTNPAATSALTGVGSGCTINLYEGQVNPFAGLIARLQVLANAPFEWGPPNGYPDAEQAWIGNLLGRWELLGDLVRNEVPGIAVDQDALLNLVASVPGDQVGEYLNMIMAGGNLSSEEESLVQAYFNAIVYLATQPQGGPPYLPQEEWGLAIAELFALVGTAPSYQYY